ncbi:MAG: DUF1918 domain-containing protein [Pseudonocardiaceae bacterium]
MTTQYGTTKSATRFNRHIVIKGTYLPNCVRLTISAICHGVRSAVDRHAKHVVGAQRQPAGGATANLQPDRVVIVPVGSMRIPGSSPTIPYAPVALGYWWRALLCLRIVGQHDRTAEVIEALGEDGRPPCRVRFEDGH